MKLSNVRKLQPGDQVTWNDPDGGACSRTDKIREITVKGDIVCITWQDGGEVECYARELS